MPRLLNKKGFVLLETIVVIAVLCVVLIMLYASYSNILVIIKKGTIYNNTEYLYKTNIIRNKLENMPNCLNSIINTTDAVYTVCTSSADGHCDENRKAECFDTNGEVSNILNSLNVKSIYVTPWVSDISKGYIRTMELSVQLYIKNTDEPDKPGAKRIIIKYKDENLLIDETKFQIASLRFGSRD